MGELGTDLDIESSGDGITLRGEIDAHTAPDLEAALATCLDAPSPIVTLHMGGVTFMDSSGLRVVLAATRTAREAGGDVVLASPTSTVRRLIEVSGLDDHLTLHDGAG